MLLVLVFAAAYGTVFAVTIDTSILKPSSPGGSGIPPASIVAGIYKFALATSGILAFGAIVFGAIRYTVAAGNPGGQKEGKEWITQALIGLVLLAGAYLILNLLNPQIFEGSGTNVRLRDLPGLEGVIKSEEGCLNTCLAGYSCFPVNPPDPNNPNKIVQYRCIQSACIYRSDTGKVVIGCPTGKACVKSIGNPWPTYNCEFPIAGIIFCATQADCKAKSNCGIGSTDACLESVTSTLPSTAPCPAGATCMCYCR